MSAAPPSRSSLALFQMTSEWCSLVYLVMPVTVTSCFCFMVLMEVLFAHNQIYVVDLYMFNRTYLIGLAEVVIS